MAGAHRLAAKQATWERSKAIKKRGKNGFNEFVTVIVTVKNGKLPYVCQHEVAPPQQRA